MKKTIYVIIALMASMSMNAQVVKLYKGDTLVKEYSQDVVDNVEFVENTSAKEELPAGTEITGTIMVNGESQRKAIGGTISDYVDLGLPSETLWATHNLGATKASDYGCYLAWGELGTREEGYFKGVKFYDGDWCYSYADYKFTNSEKYKYTFGNPAILEESDDPATMNWGECWRTPTKAQLKELTTVCTWEKTTIDEVPGYKVIGTNGNFIFLPASGYRYDNKVDCKDENGFYWSRTRDNSYGPVTLEFSNKTSTSGTISERYVHRGLSLRPVRK